MNLYLKLLKLARPYWYILLLGIVASLLFVAFNSISVWLTASFIDVLFPTAIEQTQLNQAQSPETHPAAKSNLNERIKGLTNRFIQRDTPLGTLKLLCGVLLVAFLLKNIFYYIKGIALGFVQLKFTVDLRNQLYQQLHSLSLSFYHRKKEGEISSILLNDVNAIQQSFKFGFDKLIVEPINIATFVVLLFIISWRLTLMAIFLLPISGILITQIGRSIRRKSIRSSKQIAGLMSIIHETINGIRVVKAFAMEKFETNRFFREADKYFRLLFRRRRLREISSPINETLGVVIGVILLWYGGSQVLAGRGLAAEDFVRFIVMLFAILNPIKSLNVVSVEIQQGIASAIRIFTILDEEPEIAEKPNAGVITDFHARIEYDHVSFRYAASPDLVLDDIQLDIAKGEIVAFVGHSGAGKSTLVDLLPRFYDPTTGTIRIDGRDIRDLTLPSLRSLMGIVTQETILFNDTIFNNIAYGMDNIDPQAVEAAARAANALEFIQTLPTGFETIIGDKGERLSGGQRQRLAIARALLKNPPILILDEATSSLDTESELKVQSAIENLMKDRTVLVIAHRLSTIQNAHKIVVLDRGGIVETGTHQSLLDQGGLYKYFYNIQFNIDSPGESNLNT